MAVGWIRIDRGIGDDPKIASLAFMLKDKEQAVIGYLVLVFAAMAQHAKDGDLTNTAEHVIEQWARWHGKRGRFAAAFRAVFAPNGRIESWHKHNGSHIEKAENDARRMRDVRATDALQQPDVRGNGRKDGTDGTASPSPPRAREELSLTLKTAVPDRDQVFLNDLLDRVPYRLSWIRAFEGALQGIHYKPLTGPQLAQAVREFLGNIGPQEKPNMRWFEQHVRTIATGERPRSKRGGMSKIDEGLAHLQAFAAKGETDG